MDQQEHGWRTYVRKYLTLRNCIIAAVAIFAWLVVTQGFSRAVSTIFTAVTGIGFWVLLFGAPIFFVRRWAKKKLAGAVDLYKENSEAEMARLGATVESRSAKIEDIFNRRTESLAFESKDSTFAASFSRPLAAMTPREREALRAAYHLHNIGAFPDNNFCLARMALIFGEGKATVFKGPFNPADGDFSGAVKRFTGLSSEAAVSLVLDWLQKAVNERSEPIVKTLAGRLLGGGQAALSATGEFAATQGDGTKPSLSLGLAEDTGKLVFYGGEGSVITVAPPGSGKTQCHVFPTLLTWKGPAVVLDVKGEIYAGTSKWRKENVGPVYKFSPLDPGSSHAYNPLTAVRSDPDYLWEDSLFLADMMIVPTEAKDPFFETRARDVLTAAIARACLTEDPARRSLSNVLDVINGVGWDEFIRELQSNVDIRSMARAGNSLGEMERKTRDGVLQTALTSLRAWDGERIGRATRKSDWSPLDLRGGTNPTIYICLRANEVDSYISMLRVFIAQHIRMLTSSLPPKDAPPILFLLDELPRLGRMPPVEEALEIGRQYGIRLWMFTQSVGQLEKAYPNANGIIGSCALRMYMNPSLHDGTAQKISDDIGFQEGVLDGVRQKIVEPPVLAGPDYRDFVIAMPSSAKPFRLRKRFAYQDAEISSRMGSL